MFWGRRRGVLVLVDVLVDVFLVFERFQALVVEMAVGCGGIVLSCNGCKRRTIVKT